MDIHGNAEVSAGDIISIFTSLDTALRRNAGSFPSLLSSSGLCGLGLIPCLGEVAVGGGVLWLVGAAIFRPMA
jgi:hypothetical protein